MEDSIINEASKYGIYMVVIRKKVVYKDDITLQNNLHIFIFYYYKIIYLVYRSLFVSFAQGGTGVPCPPFSIF